ASPNQLRDLSALLTASGVNAVYNEDASDEGKKQTTPPPPSAHDPAQDTAQDGANDADATQGPDDVSEAPAPEEAKDTAEPTDVTKQTDQAGQTDTANTSDPTATADGQAVSDETPTDAPTTQDATAPDEAAAKAQQDGVGDDDDDSWQRNHDGRHDVEDEEISDEQPKPEESKETIEQEESAEEIREGIERILKDYTPIRTDANVPQVLQGVEPPNGPEIFDDLFSLARGSDNHMPRPEPGEGE
ncbi:MAG: hypothetical protein OIF56_09570, partial [Cohaesibacter sp.]|nr:hypothetical protein [Cohaesibacter sp.]